MWRASNMRFMGSEFFVHERAMKVDGTWTKAITKCRLARGVVPISSM